MIQTFEEYLEEGLWKSGIERSKSGEERKENKGAKVHTSLGVDVNLLNPDMDYESAIEEIMSQSYRTYYYPGCKFVESSEHNSRQYKRNSYTTPMDVMYMKDALLRFYSYSVACEDHPIKEKCLEQDYKSICKCVAKAFMKIDLAYLGERGCVCGLLVDDVTLSKCFEELSGENRYTRKVFDEWVKHFEKDFKKEFPNEFRYLVPYSSDYNYRFGGYGILLTKDTIREFEKYKKFTKEWFELE